MGSPLPAHLLSCSFCLYTLLALARFPHSYFPSSLHPSIQTFPGLCVVPSTCWAHTHDTVFCEKGKSRKKMCRLSLKEWGGCEKERRRFLAPGKGTQVPRGQTWVPFIALLWDVAWSPRSRETGVKAQAIPQHSKPLTWPQTLDARTRLSRRPRGPSSPSLAGCANLGPIPWPQESGTLEKD